MAKNGLHMFRVKKTFLKNSFAAILTAALLMFSMTPLAVVAVDVNETVCQSANQEPTICKDKSQGNPIVGKDGIITKAIQVVAFLSGALAVILVIIGGLRYVISGGDSNGIKGAKDTIIYALVGLVVAISAQVIVTFVISKL